MIIFSDGKKFSIDDQLIKPIDRGFSLGDGIFETIKIKNYHPQLFNFHMDRFFKSANYLNIEIKFSKRDLKNSIIELSKLNKLKDAVARVTLTRGEGERGLLGSVLKNSRIFIVLSTFKNTATPVRAIISQSTRRNEFSPLSKIKSISYLDNIIAAEEANKNGFDDAILLNTSGRVSESTISNVFIRVDNNLFTPSVSEGALPGTIRRHILENYNALEKKITIEDIKNASEAFLTNALSIKPLVCVDENTVGAGEVGELTKAITDGFD